MKLHPSMLVILDGSS